MKKNSLLIGKVMIITLLVLTTVVLFSAVIYSRTVGFKLLAIALAIYFVIIAVILLGILHKRINKILSICTMIIALLLSGINVAGTYYVSRSIRGLHQLSSSVVTHRKVIQFLALKQDIVSKPKDLDKKEVVISTIDSKDLTQIKNELKKENITVAFKTSDTYVGLLREFSDGKHQYVAIDKAQLEEFKKSFDKFDEKVKVIYEISYDVEDKLSQSGVSDITKNPFVVYISGIDTYGNLNTVSRSDVNLLMVVNPQKHEILLVNMPRDLFVHIPRVDDYDKLTHTGLMGISAGIETLEKFFDNKINYYARLNFSSMIELIDLLGGVTVNNPKEFYTGSWDESQNRILFKQGEITLNGAQAMVYARDRYAHQDGDFDRARNQRRIVEGIIKKLTSSQTLFNFDKILNQLPNIVQTNLSVNQMQDLIRYQLDTGKPWKIYTQEVRSTSGMSGGYYSSQPLSMQFPIIESRLNVINQIENMLNGDPVSESIVSTGTTDYRGSR